MTQILDTTCIAWSMNMWDSLSLNTCIFTLTFSISSNFVFLFIWTLQNSSGHSESDILRHDPICWHAESRWFHSHTCQLKQYYWACVLQTGFLIKFKCTSHKKRKYFVHVIECIPFLIRRTSISSRHWWETDPSLTTLGVFGDWKTIQRLVSGFISFFLSFFFSLFSIYFQPRPSKTCSYHCIVSGHVSGW